MATRQPLPRDGHAAVGIGGKMVVWGGYGGPTKIKTSTLEIFDVCSVTWQQPLVLHGSHMPDGLYGTAVTTEGLLLRRRSGPYHNYTYHNTVFQIIPSQRLCQELPLPSPFHTAPEKALASCIVHFKDKLILYGGFTRQNLGTPQSDELYVLDIRNSECKLCCCMHDS